MRLLLDEHFPRRIAGALRERGHDVVALTETNRRGISDEELFEFARSERRALVTQDIADFSVLLREATLEASDHHGVVFVPRRVWSSLKDFDRLVEEVDEFLLARSDEDALLNAAAWLG